MGSNSAASVNMLGWFSFMSMVVLLLMMVGSVRSSDMAKEREECTNQLISLATCLPYVGGTAKAPTSTCCTALKQVVVQSKKCLCILIRDRDDPSLALKINATLALGLPATCKASADVKKCPSILNLAPNSPQAKVFEDFDGLMGKGANNSTTPSSNGNSASSVTGGNGKTPNDGHSHSHNKGVIGAGVFSLWCLTLLLIMGV